MVYISTVESIGSQDACGSPIQYLFAYKTGPIFIWEIVNILFRLVYKTKEGKQVTRETHFSVKLRLY